MIGPLVKKMGYGAPQSQLLGDHTRPKSGPSKDTNYLYNLFNLIICNSTPFYYILAAYNVYLKDKEYSGKRSTLLVHGKHKAALTFRIDFLLDICLSQSLYIEKLRYRK